MNLPQISDYAALFVNDHPLLDVRAPVEFQQGTFPLAQNFPLLNDNERHAIGLRYKEAGKENAIKLGQELVSGDTKEQRISNWITFVEQNPGGALYCFRGGMRSKICQQWIYENAGIQFPRIEGGYKAMRRFLIDELETAASTFKPVVLGGRTGVGKTIALNQVKQKLDLEGIFNHRGSAFGNHANEQPRQINIENTIAIELLKFKHQKISRILLEDEAPNIGSRRIPDSLVTLSQQSPLVLLEASVSERTDNVYDEYVLQSLCEYQQIALDNVGFDIWADNVCSSLNKIQRRLGGDRYNKIHQMAQDALMQHRNQNNPEVHKEWIRTLLIEYYDPMYDYQIGKKSDRIVFRGDKLEVLDYIARHFEIT